MMLHVVTGLTVLMAVTVGTLLWKALRLCRAGRLWDAVTAIALACTVYVGTLRILTALL